MKKKMSVLFFVSGVVLYGLLVATDYFMKFPSELYFILSLLCTFITICGIVLYFTKIEQNSDCNPSDKTVKKLRSILGMLK